MICLICRSSAGRDIIANCKITIFFNKSKFIAKTAFTPDFLYFTDF